MATCSSSATAPAGLHSPNPHLSDGDANLGLPFSKQLGNLLLERPAIPLLNHRFTRVVVGFGRNEQLDCSIICQMYKCGPFPLNHTQPVSTTLEVMAFASNEFTL